MAVQFIEEPDSVRSAYRPHRFRLLSTLAPVAQQTTDIGTLTAVRRPTAAELSTYVQLSKNDVLFELAMSSVVRGTWINVLPGGSTAYVGKWRVKSVVIPGLFVVDATWYGAEPALFEDVRRFYRGHYIQAVLSQINDVNNAVEVERVRIFADEDGFFHYDPAVAMRSQLGHLAPPRAGEIPLFFQSNAWAQDGTGKMASRYLVEFSEWYETPDPDTGIPSVVEDKATRVKSSRVWATNVVPPYLFMNRDGSAGHNYLTTEEQVTVPPAPGFNSGGIEFATNVPRGKLTVPIDGYLSVGIYAHPDAPAVKLRVRRFNASGGSLGTSVSTAIQLPVGTQIPIGPAHLGTTYIPATTAYYLVDLRDSANTFSVTEELRIDIDTACGEVEREFQWMNPFGATDSFIFRENETMSEDVEEELFERAIDIRATTDFPDFTWRASNVQVGQTYSTRDRVHRDVAFWLRELARSPVRFTFFGGSTIAVPVILAGTASSNALDTARYRVPVSLDWMVAARPQSQSHNI